MRHVLVPAPAYPRVAAGLSELPHDINVVLWTPEGITDVDGTPVDEAQPEAAWLSIDLLFAGDFMPFAQSVVDVGSMQWVQGPLAGFDAPPFRTILNAGIRLSNSDAPNIGVAEYAMSALLAHRHGIAQRLANERNAEWAQQPWPEIGGQRWAIVGFGSIGHEIAKRARPFGVHIVGVRRSAVDDAAADAMATMQELPSVLASADVVILACPLTDETRGMVNEEFLSAMQPDAVLVNVSRGAVVDHDALIEGLDSATISHAILDVFDPEPLASDSPLWSHDKVTVTSHIAGAGAGFMDRNDQLFIEQLDDYLAGRPLRLEVTNS